MLLVCSIVAMGQIKPIKRQSSTTPKTEKTKKNPKQSNSSSTSGKSKKTGKISAHQSSSHFSQSSSHSFSSNTATTTLPAVVQQTVNDMVWIASGTFTMGEFTGDESPSHQVALNGYYIGRYEVTQELWQTIMGSNPSRFKGNGKRPVENVSWNDCQSFIKKLNQLTGKNFRLPTEAEWEYAACGGKASKGYKFAGSNQLYNVAWYNENSGGTTHPVGTRAPNELGLYDMSGNVFEWCQDWFGVYSDDMQTNPIGQPNGSDRISRGGSWRSTWKVDASFCCVSSRFYNAPSSSDDNRGLRLAATSL